ncbi:hypothetical protein EFM80_02925 [Streptococcus thermophilus]|nr:hypothetical protein [Streptococcus thermophilus]MCT2949764.1 hypothetical protein [Streptococcus thermophilus]
MFRYLQFTPMKRYEFFFVELYFTIYYMRKAP